jgi:hypothetical protein
MNQYLPGLTGAIDKGTCRRIILTQVFGGVDLACGVSVEKVSQGGALVTCWRIAFARQIPKLARNFFWRKRNDRNQLPTFGLY